MQKYDIIKECLYFEVPNVDSIFVSLSKRVRKQITTEDFINIISKEKYNLAELGVSSVTSGKLLKELFPNRITTSTGNKPCTYLLHLYEYKWCSSCKEVKVFEDFRPNKAQKCGLNTFCKICQSATTAKTQPYRQKLYQSAKLKRTPSWANLEKIKEWYDNCPIGYHVDHIVPLQGELVSGFHVENNLQYLTAHDNIVKHNKFGPVV